MKTFLVMQSFLKINFTWNYFVQIKFDKIFHSNFNCLIQLLLWDNFCLVSYINSNVTYALQFLTISEVLSLKFIQKISQFFSPPLAYFSSGSKIEFKSCCSLNYLYLVQVIQYGSPIYNRMHLSRSGSLRGQNLTWYVIYFI